MTRDSSFNPNGTETVSLARHLKLVMPELSEYLVSPQALANLERLLQTLPPISTAGFECRLAPGQNQVDFGVAFANYASQFQQIFARYPQWQTLESFWQKWLNTADRQQYFNGLLLEFDLLTELDTAAVVGNIPSLFLGLKASCLREFTGLEPLIQSLLPNSNPAVLSQVKACYDALPPGAGITHLGAMLSRSDQGVRLNMAGLPPEQLPTYLAAIGWQDTTEQLSPLLSTLSDYVESARILAIDVGAKVSPRIGLECYFSHQPKQEPRWQAFLDYLVEQGLCTPTKAAALLNWPGAVQASQGHPDWPENLSLGDRFFGSHAGSVFVRWINHLKLVYTPGYPLEVKAYPTFKHCWVETPKKTENHPGA